MNNRTLAFSRSQFLALIATLGLLLAAAPPAVAASDAGLDGWRQCDAKTQAYVLSLARRAFDAYVRDHAVIDCPRDLPTLLRSRSGVFVSTMGPDGAPRCCMGTLYPVEPDVAHEIISNAVTAAGRDRRFAPIKVSELAKLKLIVSIVGRPEPITESEAAALDPVRDGLVVKNGDRFGVMLSGETPHIDLMLRWGRIRAGAGPHTAVQFFRLDDVRFMEGL
jgi:AMMECR1 domain-containing protein